MNEKILTLGLSRGYTLFMQIYKGVSQMSSKNSDDYNEAVSPQTTGIEASVVTIGNFDGVHLGHQQLIDTVVREAQFYGIPSVVYTFDPHPLKVVVSERSAGKNVARLFDLKDQQEQFAARGVNIVIVEPFTKEFAQVTAQDFLSEYLFKNLRPKTLVVGHDFSFGAKRGGTISFLEQFCANNGIRLIIIPPFQNKNIVVSSSKIRDALAAGDVETANGLLGRSYYVRGHVQKGFQRGRLIGVPTANIHPDVEFMPRKGVYATYTKFGGQLHKSITNIGVNPTFNEADGTQNLMKIESHIFDFNAQLYDVEVEVILLHFIRDEKKFNGIEELKNQIQSDIHEVQGFFDGNNKIY